MTNHARTVLMNLGDRGVAEEHICGGCGVRSLSPTLQAVYSVLFGDPVVSRTAVLAQGYCLLRLVEAAGMQHYLTEQDTRLTYQDDRDFDYQLVAEFDLRATMERLQAGAKAIDRMFQSLPVEDPTPQMLWLRNPNAVHRIAGMVVGFIQRAQP